MSYFKEENFRGDKRLPNNFMTGFLEVRTHPNMHLVQRSSNAILGSQLGWGAGLDSCLYVNNNQILQSKNLVPFLFCALTPVQMPNASGFMRAEVAECSLP